MNDRILLYFKTKMSEIIKAPDHLSRDDVQNLQARLQKMRQSSGTNSAFKQSF